MNKQISKFKNANELLKAYQSLEKEFTKRCQRLKELESKRLKQSNKNILFVNDQLIKRNQELEEALLDMVVQFCQMGEEGYLKHTFMSAEEQAFNVLEIQYGEKISEVYKRFFKRWGKEYE